MYDFLVPFLGGMFTEYFRSRKTSKKKIFAICFFIFSGLFAACIFTLPSEKSFFFLFWLVMAGGALMATTITAVHGLNELLEKRKQRKAAKQDDLPGS